MDMIIQAWSLQPDITRKSPIAAADLIQFPDQLYIGFDIIVVDKSCQVPFLVFQVFYVYTFGSPFRYIYITVRQ